MFSSYKRLKQRTKPKRDLDRPTYLQALVSEYQDTGNQDDKLQVLANLANFAYDPINFEYLRQLQVIDLFLDCLTDDEDINSKSAEFGISGVCNLTADPKNRDIVLETEDSIRLVTRCLSSSNTETVLSGMTTLMQLILPKSRDSIITPTLISSLFAFKEYQDSRVSNLATVFLEDYCTDDEMERFRNKPSPS